MENRTFIEVSLSDVRVIMTIMCVLVVEFLYKTVMGHVPILEWLFARHTWVPMGRSCLV
jgi:hypothetical protein